MNNSRPFSSKLLLFFLLLIVNPISASHADQNADADVISVEAIDGGDSGWTFHVTVKHPDTGWSDYCNGWDVVTDRDEILKHQDSDPFTRLLFHPHVGEQPFTRSESGLKIPKDVKTLIIRAHDIVHGFGGQEIIIDLDSNNGPGYNVIRN